MSSETKGKGLMVKVPGGRGVGMYMAPIILKLALDGSE
jgi:hypothetical protein